MGLVCRNNIFGLLLFCLLWIILSVGVHAQTWVREVSGSVLDSVTKRPLENAIVSARIENDIVAYTQTDINGNFSIKIPVEKLASAYLHVSTMGYAAQKSKLDPNKVAGYDFQLPHQAVDLKEVTVKYSPPISEKHDTLSYKMSAFSNAQDRTIGDVLKKLPGIEVDDNGTVRYNGKPVNKFYIEGLDLLERKYGIAVNNVTAGDVSDVEVLQNHQPIKALEDKVYSDQAAINLKLKNAAKAKWLGTVGAEAGASPFLWKGEGMAMKIKGRSQSINTLKTNNSGQNVIRELQALNIQDILNGQDNLMMDAAKVNLQASQPPVREERSLFNRTISGALNNLGLAKNGWQIRTNITLADDRRTGGNNANTVHFLGNSRANASKIGVNKFFGV